MTVQNQTAKTGPTAGDGANQAFSFSPIVIFDEDDIIVTRTITATGVETVLVP